MDDPRERARAYVLRQLARCKAEFERQGADGLTLNPLARRRFAPSNATISRLFADPPLVVPDLETVIGLAAALGVQLEEEDTMVGAVGDAGRGYGEDGRVVAAAEAVARMKLGREMLEIAERLEAMTPAERRGALKLLGLAPPADGRA